MQLYKLQDEKEWTKPVFKKTKAVVGKFNADRKEANVKEAERRQKYHVSCAGIWYESAVLKICFHSVLYCLYV
jgi:hypothetical protein